MLDFRFYLEMFDVQLSHFLYSKNIQDTTG